jgi:hypothetical protein
MNFLAIVFCVLYIIGFFFSGFYFYKPVPNAPANYGWTIPYILIGILGYVVFGAALHRI